MQRMADKKAKSFRFVVVGGGIAGVTCVEQVKWIRVHVRFYVNDASEKIVECVTACAEMKPLLTASVTDPLSRRGSSNSRTPY